MPRPSAKVSAAPSWWRWRRTIAASNISSRSRRRRRRSAADCSSRCSGRSRSSRRAAAATRRVCQCRGHLPHRLRAHLRRLLLPDLVCHHRRQLCRRREGLPAILPGGRGAAFFSSQSGRGHEPGGVGHGQQPYSSLPNAFRYRTSLDQSCSCRRPGETWSQALEEHRGHQRRAGRYRGERSAGPAVVAAARRCAGPPIKLAPLPAPARPEGGAGRAAAARCNVAAESRRRLPAEEPSKPDPNRQVRSVGPTFLPATRRRCLEIERFGLARRAGLEQRAVRLRHRRAGVAEAVDDRITAVAAEILQRHLDAGRRLPALVFGEIEQPPDLEHDVAVEARGDDVAIGSSRSTSRSRIWSSMS